MLRLHHVDVRIAGVHVLRNVSFALAPGMTTALIGRNGAGKTTTLRTVMGFIPPEKAELPDISPEDIELNVNNDTLTISGEKRFSNEVKEDQFHRIERRYGAFSRSFSLPTSVDATKISAEHKNGVLTVRLPAREEAKPRQIKVDVRS